MPEAVELAQPSRSGGRQTKFTPDKVRQITNLVERGKSREEIADIIGVTPATLQVTCSRLKISLRRPRFDTGTRLLSRRSSSSNASDSPPSLGYQDANQEPMNEAEPLPEATTENGFTCELDSAREGRRKDDNVSLSPKFALHMQYKDEDKRTELALDGEMIARLAIEAEFRNVRIGQLVGQLIRTIIERDLFHAVLEPIDPS